MNSVAGFVPHDSHELIAGSAFDVEHLASLQSNEARVREVEWNREPRYSKWREPFLGEPDMGAESKSAALERVIERIDARLQPGAFDGETEVLDPELKKAFVGPGCPWESSARHAANIHAIFRYVHPLRGFDQMERKTAHDFDQELLILFDAYVHGGIDRRAFLDKAAKFAVGGVTAAMLLEQLSPKFLEAQVVNPQDSRIVAEYKEYESPKGYGKMRGYLVRPAKVTGKLPGILVVHENRGLNPHIEDVTRRLALENFIAFAPDALFPLGGYPGNEDKARELFAQLDQAKTREDFIAAAAVLKSQPQATGRIGAVGFCYGGGMVNFLAAQLGNDLAAGVPFYGSSPALEDVPKIKAPLMIQSAENDPRINASWPAFEEALKAANIKYERYLYPGTQHGFHNDTTPRYDEAAAKLAWQRTLAFFNKNVRS